MLLFYLSEEKDPMTFDTDLDAAAPDAAPTPHLSSMLEHSPSDAAPTQAARAHADPALRDRRTQAIMDEAAILSAALALAADGYSVIPVHAVRLDEQGSAHCTCGKPACSNIGKHPAISWTHWQQHRASDAQINAWFGPGQPYARLQYQVSLPGPSPGVFVVDVDSVAPGKQGPETLATLQLRHDDCPRPSAHTPEAVVNTCSFAIQVCRSGARRTHSASMWTCAAKAASSSLLIAARERHSLRSGRTIRSSTELAEAPEWLMAGASPIPLSLLALAGSNGGEVLRNAEGKVFDGRDSVWAADRVGLDPELDGAPAPRSHRGGSFR